MSLTNPNKLITEERLSDFYQQILPYLSRGVEAGFTPVGTVIAVMGNSAPANYLACDGAVYNIVEYKELAAYFNSQFGSSNYFGGNGTTTFAVPDLRGEFLRGTGTNSHTNQGSGANVGVHQDATDLLHWVRYDENHYLGAKGNNITENNVDSRHNGNLTVTGRTYLNNSSTDNFDTDKVFITARPTNTSVLYCIATKNIYLNPSLDYSTDEKVVGTWIDGKPLYQKTVDINRASTSGVEASTVTNTSNVSKILFFEYQTILKDTTTFNGLVIATSGSGISRVRGNIDIGVINLFHLCTIESWITNSSIENIYVTIQYTKTTD